MTRSNPDGDPRILRLRAADDAVVALIEAVVAAAARPGVRLACDIDPRLRCEVDGDAVAGLLAALLDAAVAAALAPDPDSDVPALREVLVTAVHTGDALEIEVADSGPARVWQPPSGDTRRFLAASGGSLVAVACAEGGTAVTLRLPQRRARGLAA